MITNSTMNNLTATTVALTRLETVIPAMATPVRISTINAAERFTVASGPDIDDGNVTPAEVGTRFRYFD